MGIKVFSLIGRLVKKIDDDNGNILCGVWGAFDWTLTRRLLSGEMLTWYKFTVEEYSRPFKIVLDRLCTRVKTLSHAGCFEMWIEFST